MARSAHQSAQRYPLTRILGTDATLRVVRELARHGGQLSAPGLVSRTGLAKASVARGLEALAESRIAEAAGTGRSVLYRLRHDHPVAPALCALFEAEEARFAAVLDSIRSAAEASGPGIAALWLFGSVARGDDGPGSDLDLALVAARQALPAVAEALRDGLVAPAARIGFNPSVVALDADDVLRLSGGRDPWWVSTAGSAIPIIGPRPDELASRLARTAPSPAAA